MEINDVQRIGGVFTISTVRGVPKHLGPLWRWKKKRILKKGGTPALIEHYKSKGAVLVDEFDAPNRFVNEGLALIVNLLKGTASTPLPTKVQLGSGATGLTYVSADRVINTVKNIPAAYSTNGLAEDVFTTAAAIGDNGSTGNKLTFVREFVASADVLTGSAPDEVMIRTHTPTVKALCYAPFPAGERTLASGDHLIVTYALTLVP